VIPRLSLNHTLPSKPIALAPQQEAVIQLENLLRSSLSLRVLGVPDPTGPSIEDSIAGRTAKVALLFSGGLDCTVLARMAHDLLPTNEPIDLLNVAFENPRIHKMTTLADDSTHNTETSYELCPDRITGRASHAELEHTCSRRQWRFVAINIPYKEYLEHRATVISLMHPHNTEMDLSIALALYFAARGRGLIAHGNSKDTLWYTTSARVLMSGLGADELFAGYVRHATAHRRGGMDALLDELELDISRLGKRNLGRDDRVMSRWGREVRFPYLDEKLLAWALAAPVSDKCGFGEADDANIYSIEPGKKVLRCLALKLGMEKVAIEKKRAVRYMVAFAHRVPMADKSQIQFGARTAKMGARKTKGTQILEH
jgi:asparagine synthetase B (glutamine-hydrolysing)